MELKRFLHPWLNCCLTKGWIFPEGRSCYKTRPSPHSFPRGGGFCSQQFLSQTSFQKAITPGLNNSNERRKQMFPNTQVFTFDIDFNYILALWTSTNWSMLFLGFDISAFQYPELYLSGYWTSETPSTPLYIHTSGIKQ